MDQEKPSSGWKTNWLKSSFTLRKRAIRPAEIAGGLCKIMLSSENLLEDAHYNKIVPNHFVVELSTQNYTFFYEPITTALVQQWRDQLVEHLMTANSRQGRKEYRLGGQLRIEIRPAQDLNDQQACIFSRLASEQEFVYELETQEQPAAYLEALHEDRRWSLYPGDNTIGRDRLCNIFLDLPAIQEKRLVSAEHARISIEGDQCVLYDGSRAGKPSANGTYLNYYRVTDKGSLLRNGDIIILAAVHPGKPVLDAPGTAAFRFSTGQKDIRRPLTPMDG
jgi:hypothetical protein